MKFLILFMLFVAFAYADVSHILGGHKHKHDDDSAGWGGDHLSPPLDGHHKEEHHDDKWQHHEEKHHHEEPHRSNEHHYEHHNHEEHGHGEHGHWEHHH